MQTYDLSITGRSIRLESADSTLVRTSIGVDQMRFLFADEEWLGFDLSAAVSNGIIAEVPLQLESAEGYAAVAVCAVPDEVLEHDGQLGVTVHGVDADGNHIITESAFPLTVMLEG